MIGSERRQPVLPGRGLWHRGWRHTLIGAHRREIGRRGAARRPVPGGDDRADDWRSSSAPRPWGQGRAAIGPVEAEILGPHRDLAPLGRHLDATAHQRATDHSAVLQPDLLRRQHGDIRRRDVEDTRRRGDHQRLVDQSPGDRLPAPEDELPGPSRQAGAQDHRQREREGDDSHGCASGLTAAPLASRLRPRV